MIEKIEKRLKELVPLRDETLFEAARYTLLSNGKRIRPLLTLATAGIFGLDPLLAMDPACAVEMIHAYSLIHDDLPSMDNDDLRRGKPTLHMVYGEAMALLTGDYLLTYAFEVIANAKELGVTQKLEMIKALSRGAGSSGMIGGQVIDIESKGKEIDEETLFEMHQGKTSALITAALELGSLAAGYPPNNLLKSIGSDLGMIYQLQDDLLDATSTTAVLGKTTGSDAKQNKPTAVSILGISKTGEMLSQIEQSLFKKVKELPNQGALLAIVIKKILLRKH